KSRITKISLALSSRRDNHPSAATAKMASLIVAAFPSRLSRYTLVRANGAAGAFTALEEGALVGCGDA
ncbi:MAG: hypothetical protein ACLPGW_04730, partial [Roseiarcus sp.]